jgi:hypothetical protein
VGETVLAVKETVLAAFENQLLFLICISDIVIEKSV